MSKNELEDGYLEWMRQLVCDKQYSGRLSYRKLLRYLHRIEFTYILQMDENRAEDGIDLRRRFEYEHNYESGMVSEYLDRRPCSVLEMLVALAVRCEEHIMDDPEAGNRTGKWFWIMIKNLGLSSMYDARFDRDYADHSISRLLNREYGRNGEGGLFTLKHCRCDLRCAEIWYQMCWYLSENL